MVQDTTGQRSDIQYVLVPVGTSRSREREREGMRLKRRNRRGGNVEVIVRTRRTWMKRQCIKEEDKEAAK